MQIKQLLSFAFLFCASHSFAQKNLKLSPEKPQAGQPIEINYTPANELMGTKSTVNGIVYTIGPSGVNAHDITLKKSGNQYLGTVSTDTSDNFVFFSFSADDVFDKANGEGFKSLLYEGDKAKKAAYSSLGNYYFGFITRTGIDDVNAEKALEAYKKEAELYPDRKSDLIIPMVRMSASLKKEDAPALFQKEIEALIKSGLKTEEDYNTLRTLYGLARLPAQAEWIGNLAKEKFPNGSWQVSDAAQKYQMERDPEKKESMLDNLLAKSKTEKSYEIIKKSEPTFVFSLASAYAAKGDYENLDRVVKKYNFSGPLLARLYNSEAWKLQEKEGGDLNRAEKYAQAATEWAKNEWKKPTEEKPATTNERAWEKNRQSTYASNADTYAMVLFKQGNYKKGLPYAEEGALKIMEGKSADQNSTYALLASKVLNPKKYVPQLEKFVIDGKATSEIKDILKEAYNKKNAESGFDAYYAKLERESYLKMIEELKKSMMNETAPKFALLDLDGKKVSLQDLKNKVVIVDFWATWCGPCIASFPGMQKAVTKYKDDPEVKFVFVNTWENVENKEKNAGDFMKSKNYDFHVLMDNDNKVVESFKVTGIPTKFIIDKKGVTRFKSVGFGGSDDKLVTELTAMIDLAKAQ